MTEPSRSAGGARLSGVRLILAGVAALVLASLGAVGAEAQSAVVQERPNAEVAREAISRLRSPYCPGFMLEACTSSAAAALRDSIYDLAAEGMTADELVEWMLNRHGEEWRGVPQRSGAGLWAWIIPPVALLSGLGILVGWLRSNRESRGHEGGPAVPAVSSADREELATAMREWESSGGEEP